MQTRTHPPTDSVEPRDELVAACRALLKRVRHLEERGRELMSVSPKFGRCLVDAGEFLRAASEVLVDSSIPIPEIRNRHVTSGYTPRKIAEEMSHALRNDSLRAPPPSPPTVLANQDESDASLLHGAATSVSISELLEFLAALKKSGVLWVTTKEETFTIQLRDGFVINAFSNNAPQGQRLGDILIEQGGIDEGTFVEFLAEYSRSQGRIGEVLARRKLISAEQLTNALEYQVQQLFHRMFGAQRATFSFSERRSLDKDPQLNMNLTRLLLESARNADEQPAKPPSD